MNNNGIAPALTGNRRRRQKHRAQRTPAPGGHPPAPQPERPALNLQAGKHAPELQIEFVRPEPIPLRIDMSKLGLDVILAFGQLKEGELDDGEVILKMLDLFQPLVDKDLKSLPFITQIQVIEAISGEIAEIQRPNS